MIKKFISRSAAETAEFGRKLGRLLRGGEVIALCGQLGSGKTVLTKGIASGLDVKDARRLNSPSFVILKEYNGRMPLYHFDIYRLDGAPEFATVGYGEYFYGKGVSVVEWADKIAGALPEEHLAVNIDIAGRNERRISARPRGRRYEALLKRMRQK